MYFGHYVTFRLILAVLVILTEVFDQKWLFIVLLVTQALSLLLHLLGLYDTLLLNFQILLFWELNLTFDVSIIVYSVFKNDMSPKLGLIIACVNISFTGLFALSILCNLGFKLAKCFILWKKKVRQSWYSI